MALVVGVATVLLSVVIFIQKRRNRSGSIPYAPFFLAGYIIDRLLLAFGFKPDKLYRIQDVNEVRLAGTVLHMYRVPEREIVILTIRTYSGRVNHPKITLFGKTAQYAEETMNMGDPICAVGFLYTNRSEKEDGRAVYHEGITGTSISRIPEDEQPE